MKKIIKGKVKIKALDVAPVEEPVSTIRKGPVPYINSLVDSDGAELEDGDVVFHIDGYAFRITKVGAKWYYEDEHATLYEINSSKENFETVVGRRAAYILVDWHIADPEELALSSYEFRQKNSRF